MIKDDDLKYIFDNLSEKEKKKFENSTILITGCGGFIGYYLMNFLNEYCEKLKIKKIIGLDNFMLGQPEWIKKIAKNDIIDLHKFDIIIDNIQDIKFSDQVNLIIHMASIASPTFYRKYPIETLDANIWGLRSLFDYYKDKNIKGFLFFSSSEIYGDPTPENIPTSEEYNGNVSATGPRACYDESKRFGETMCRLFSEKYNMPIGVVRPFNNYGPGMKINDKRVPADFANAVYNNKNITILSDGRPTRTFCYVADAIVGYLKILLYGKYDYFNIGIDKPEISINQLAQIYEEKAKEVLNYTAKITYDISEDKDYLTNNPERRCPNIDKARKILNYTPSINVDEGIRRFLIFIKENDETEYLW